MIEFELLDISQAHMVKELCNGLMAFQKSKAHIRTELFDGMCFETRMLPSIENAKYNYLAIAKIEGRAIAYVYCNISPKQVYDSPFATFFNLSEVATENVGCLSQFFIEEPYRGQGIGSQLVDMSMAWMRSFDEIEDIYVFVSNGNEEAKRFYEAKGFKVSHDILDGFITVLHQKKDPQ